MEFVPWYLQGWKEENESSLFSLIKVVRLEKVDKMIRIVFYFIMLPAFYRRKQWLEVMASEQFCIFMKKMSLLC